MAARVLIVAATAELDALLAERSTIDVVGRLRPGDDLARAAATLHPDVIVLDADDAIPPALAREIPFVVLVDDASSQTNPALRAGARAVLRRDTSPDTLVAALDAAAAGLVVLHPAAVPTPPRPDSRPEPLTRREREILSLLADGLGNKIIAARLGISDHTVKAHVGAIFEKLHVGTRAEAAALGLRLGLIAL